MYVDFILSSNKHYSFYLEIIYKLCWPNTIGLRHYLFWLPRMDSNNNVTYTHMIFSSSFYTQSVYSAVVYWRQVVYPVYVLVSHFVHFHINRRQIQDKLHRKWSPLMFAYFEKLSKSTYSRYFHNLGKEYILYITIILSVIYLKLNQSWKYNRQCNVDQYFTWQRHIHVECVELLANTV